MILFFYKKFDPCTLMDAKEKTINTLFAQKIDSPLDNT